MDPGTTSSAEDLIRLGEAAMSIPVLQQMVSLGQANVPMTAVVYNLNFDLGQDGIIGVKTGSDSSAQGCYLFAAQQSIGGKQVTVVGAVLGQPGGSLGPNTTAVDAGDALVKSTFAALHSYAAFAPGQKAGEVTAPWGASAPLTVSEPVTVVGWPGAAVAVTARTRPVKGALAAGATVGTIRTGADRSHATHGGPPVGARPLVAPHALTGRLRVWLTSPRERARAACAVAPRDRRGSARGLKDRQIRPNPTV